MQEPYYMHKYLMRFTRGDIMKMIWRGNVMATNLYVKINLEAKEQAKYIFDAPLNMEKLTKEDFDKEIEKGYRDMLNGNIRGAGSAFADVRKSMSDKI